MAESGIWAGTKVQIWKLSSKLILARVCAPVAGRVVDSNLAVPTLQLEVGEGLGSGVAMAWKRDVAASWPGEGPAALTGKGLTGFLEKREPGLVGQRDWGHQLAIGGGV